MAASGDEGAVGDVDGDDEDCLQDVCTYFLSTDLRKVTKDLRCFCFVTRGMALRFTRFLSLPALHMVCELQ